MHLNEKIKQLEQPSQNHRSNNNINFMIEAQWFEYTLISKHSLTSHFDNFLKSDPQLEVGPKLEFAILNGSKS